MEKLLLTIVLLIFLSLLFCHILFVNSLDKENDLIVYSLDKTVIGNFHHHRYQIVKELDEFKLFYETKITKKYVILIVPCELADMIAKHVIYKFNENFKA